jgi:hypothetical protein
MTTQIDQKINELFAVVRKQKAEVEAAEKESKQSWKTTASIVVPFSTDTNPVNIQTANEAKVKAVVMALLKHRDYAGEAEQLLGLEQTGQYNGFSYEDLLIDCKKRITVLSIRAKKEKLALLEERLNAIVSPEQKRQMELEAIAASLA